MDDLKRQSRAKLADTYGKIARRVNALEAQRKELREELLRRRVKNFTGDRYVVTINDTPMTILNQTLLCEERPRLYAKYMTEIITKRVEVADKRDATS